MLAWTDLLEYTRILSLLNIMKMPPLKMIKKITVNGDINHTWANHKKQLSSTKITMSYPTLLTSLGLPDSLMMMLWRVAAFFFQHMHLVLSHWPFHAWVEPPQSSVLLQKQKRICIKYKVNVYQNSEACPDMNQRINEGPRNHSSVWITGCLCMLTILHVFTCICKDWTWNKPCMQLLQET